ncbi:hypothetical protein [Escherichia coli]|uniref:hypothetical protein n=1 Tax=Escherichia coli TaxID=562 RepID=UPI002023AB83|nr:hypothetical protein [Escherichia coli]
MNNLPKGAISSPRDVAVLKQWFYFMSDASMLKRIISGEQKGNRLAGFHNPVIQYRFTGYSG